MHGPVNFSTNQNAAFVASVAAQSENSLVQNRAESAAGFGSIDSTFKVLKR
jgi:hypothetical protein